MLCVRRIAMIPRTGQGLLMVQKVLMVLVNWATGVPDDWPRSSSVAELRRLLQVFSHWAHGITLPFLKHDEFVNCRPCAPLSAA